MRFPCQRCVGCCHRLHRCLGRWPYGGDRQVRPLVLGRPAPREGLRRIRWPRSWRSRQPPVPASTPDDVADDEDERTDKQDDVRRPLVEDGSQQAGSESRNDKAEGRSPKQRPPPHAPLRVVLAGDDTFVVRLADLRPKPSHARSVPGNQAREPWGGGSYPIYASGVWLYEIILEFVDSVARGDRSWRPYFGGAVAVTVVLLAVALTIG